ncbi:MAG: hypothetical protein RMJ84_12475, partial [Sandaracinaceae bacterium]|nr:hypothetical protein [Sandaracinaceae bacterium]
NPGQLFSNSFGCWKYLGMCSQLIALSNTFELEHGELPMSWSGLPFSQGEAQEAGFFNARTQTQALLPLTMPATQGWQWLWALALICCTANFSVGLDSWCQDGGFA